ncbi:cell surface protein [Enterococcus mundtii]|uniref:DUF916 and DUF3324 domain-containing protein n=1 Tax=Enterococcus mundtii TaxID=53346 RepID=UPI000D385CAD|nr:DUF916 and DUF3324 domain-containing protein [Enterococcus mundtii]PTO37552.1 cell surface protein [Enterococcus mundtii]PTO39623.1 cell surface protein [Enterococcus mundtii]
MKSIKHLALLLTILFVGMSLIPVRAQAEETGGFTIEGVTNAHQIDENISYFYLHEDPSAEDTLEVKLMNASNKEIMLNVRVTDANTNSNGIIDYSGDLENHSALKTPLSTILTPESNEVKVPANSEVVTKLKLKMPADQTNGVILGGINVSEKAAEQSGKQKKGTITVGNTYAYTLGVAVTNENEVDLYRNETVSLDGVEPELFDGRKIVSANILNPEPYIFSEANISGEIVKKGSDKAIIEQEMSDVSIAPQSTLPFHFDWGKKDLEPGTYVFKATVTSGEKKWPLEQEFTIEADKAKEINKESVFHVHIPQWLTLLMVILVAISVIGTIYLTIKKYKGE